MHPIVAALQDHVTAALTGRRFGELSVLSVTVEMQEFFEEPCAEIAVTLTEPRGATWNLRDSRALRDAIARATATFVHEPAAELATYVRFSPPS